jgi:hypothetical protein
MGAPYIRLDNRFVVKKGNKYFVTSVTDKEEWTKMSKKEQQAQAEKEVTSRVKNLIQKHGSKVSINFKTKPSKKRVRTKRKKKTKRGGN